MRFLAVVLFSACFLILLFPPWVFVHSEPGSASQVYQVRSAFVFTPPLVPRSLDLPRAVRGQSANRIDRDALVVRLLPPLALGTLVTIRRRNKRAARAESAATDQEDSQPEESETPAASAAPDSIATPPRGPRRAWPAVVLGALALAVSVGTLVYVTRVERPRFEELTIGRGLVERTLTFRPDSLGGVVLYGPGVTGAWATYDSTLFFLMESDSTSIDLRVSAREARIRVTQGGDTSYWPHPPSPSP